MTKGIVKGGIFVQLSMMDSWAKSLSDIAKTVEDGEVIFKIGKIVAQIEARIEIYEKGKSYKAGT